MKPPKPSSEKNLHAAVYRLRPDVRFVIHTHQVWASAVSTLRRDIDVPPDLVPMLGAKVRCAAFALPTTKKLADNVAAVLQQAGADERAVLLAGHGTVCFGADAEEAFAVAEALEKACQRFFRGGGEPGADDPRFRVKIANPLEGGPRFQATTGEPTAGNPGFQTPIEVPTSKPRSMGSGQDPVAGRFPSARPRPIQSGDGTAADPIPPPVRRLYNSRRFDDHFKLYVGATTENSFPEGEGEYLRIPLERDQGRLIGSAASLPGAGSAPEIVPSLKAGLPPEPGQPVPPEAVIHRRIYERWDHIRAIVHCTDEDVVEASRSGEPIRPYLDDFAQLVGPVAKVAAGNFPDTDGGSGGHDREHAGSDGQDWKRIGADARTRERVGLGGHDREHAGSGGHDREHAGSDGQDWKRIGADGHDWKRIGADAARKLRGRFAVMVQGHGALCCAPNETDALAVAYVMAKNCKAFVEGRSFGGARPIAPWEAWLMRLVYTVSYSKRAGEDGGTGSVCGGRSGLGQRSDR